MLRKEKRIISELASTTSPSAATTAKLIQVLQLLRQDPWVKVPAWARQGLAAACLRILRALPPDLPPTDAAELCGVCALILRLVLLFENAHDDSDSSEASSSQVSAPHNPTSQILPSQISAPNNLTSQICSNIASASGSFAAQMASLRASPTSSEIANDVPAWRMLLSVGTLNPSACLQPLECCGGMRANMQDRVYPWPLTAAEGGRVMLSNHECWTPRWSVLLLLCMVLDGAPMGELHTCLRPLANAEMVAWLLDSAVKHPCGLPWMCLRLLACCAPGSLQELLAPLQSHLQPAAAAYQGWLRNQLVLARITRTTTQTTKWLDELRVRLLKLWLDEASTRVMVKVPEDWNEAERSPDGNPDIKYKPCAPSTQQLCSVQDHALLELLMVGLDVAFDSLDYFGVPLRDSSNKHVLYALSFIPACFVHGVEVVQLLVGGGGRLQRWVQQFQRLPEALAADLGHVVEGVVEHCRRHSEASHMALLKQLADVTAFHAVLECVSQAGTSDCLKAASARVAVAMATAASKLGQDEVPGLLDMLEALPSVSHALPWGSPGNYTFSITQINLLILFSTAPEQALLPARNIGGQRDLPAALLHILRRTAMADALEEVTPDLALWECLVVPPNGLTARQRAAFEFEMVRKVGACIAAHRPAWMDYAFMQQELWEFVSEVVVRRRLSAQQLQQLYARLQRSKAAAVILAPEVRPKKRQGRGTCSMLVLLALRVGCVRQVTRAAQSMLCFTASPAGCAALATVGCWCAS